MKTKSYILKVVLAAAVAIFLLLIYLTGKQVINSSLKSGEKKTEKNDNAKVILNKAETVTLDNNIKMEFVLINPGAFSMGSDLEAGDSDETPIHKVNITKPYYMGKYEVTQQQWTAVMGNNPSVFKGENNPVDTVSWKDCQSFITKLSEKTGKKFSLPTEAQWEYACRAGTKTPWSFGDSEALASDYAWFNINSNKTTQPVGTKKPNPWGLYDMNGNIQEWCADWYSNPYHKGEATDPQGAVNGDSRVVRGGGWGETPTYIRSAYRNSNGPEGKNDGIGLRCVMVVE